MLKKMKFTSTEQLYPPKDSVEIETKIQLPMRTS